MKIIRLVGIAATLAAIYYWVRTEKGIVYITPGFSYNDREFMQAHGIHFDNASVRLTGDA